MGFILKAILETRLFMFAGVAHTKHRFDGIYENNNKRLSMYLYAEHYAEKGPNKV